MRTSETSQNDQQIGVSQSASSGYTVSRVISSAGFDALRPMWDVLLAESDVDTIFLSHQWLRSWWGAFGGSRELAILVMRTSDRIFGIAPLMVETNSFLGVRARTVRFIGAPDADYGDVIGKDKATICRLVYEYLMQNRRDWSKVEFEQLYEGSSALSAFRSLFASSTEVTEVAETDQCLRFTFTGTAEERAAFSIRRSHDLKRCANYFKGAGGFVVRRILGTEEIRRHLKLMYLLHWQRWNNTPTPSKFSDPSFRHMYEEVVARLENTPAICLMASYCGEIPVTLSFNFEYKGTIAHYTLAYNSYYAKKSPGTLHVIQQTEQFVHEGYLLDFARGAGPYKKLVADEEYRNYRATIYGRSWEKQVADIYRSAKRSRLGQRLMANRRVMELKARLAHDLRMKGLVQIIRETAQKMLGRLIRIEQTLVSAWTSTNQPDTSADTQCVKIAPHNFWTYALLRGILLDSTEMKHSLDQLSPDRQLYCLTDDAVPIASVSCTQSVTESPQTPSDSSNCFWELSDLFISPFMSDPEQLRYFLRAVSLSLNVEQTRVTLLLSPTILQEHGTLLAGAGVRIIRRKFRVRFFPAD